MRQWLHMSRSLLLAALAMCLVASGCGSSQRNASEADILPYYQPEPIYEASKASMTRTGDNRFLVALSGFTPSMEPQRNPSWCWAAAAARVLEHAQVRKSDGSPISQDDLVRDSVRHRSDQTANPELVMLALVPEFKARHDEAKARAEEREAEYDRGQHKGTVWDDFQPDLPGVSHMVNDILSGGPAVVAVDATDGREGHIYVAYEIEFSIAAVEGWMAQAPYFVHRIKALDPYTGQSTELLADGELTRVSLAGGRKSATDYATASTQGYERARPVRSEDKPIWERKLKIPFVTGR